MRSLRRCGKRGGMRLFAAGTLMAVLALMTVIAVPAPMAQTAGSCLQPRWVASWAGVPTDASKGASIFDVYDASNGYKPRVDNSTVRAILTPTLGGSSVRVRLSNRFGTEPVTVSRTTIAKQASGAAIAGPAVPVTFAGATVVTAAAGQDVLSDAVALTYAAFETLAVSIYVAGNAGLPTEHYLARQSSYTTPTGAGDHSQDAAGTAFSARTTTRPFVTGLEVMAPAAAVVALGDSLTDGYQPIISAGAPEATEGLDANGRWTDVLGRRLRAAGLPLSVANAGINGDRVLRDGTDPTNARDSYGPSAINRLNADVLQQSGVHAVIILEGINDIAKDVSAAEVIAGYQQLITRIRGAGVRVLLGTLTPTGGAAGGYGTAATAEKRDTINAWIRSSSPADGVVDFDAAVRDPANPARLDPSYDGADHLHLNLAGYQKMGEAVSLAALAAPTCTAAATASPTASPTRRPRHRRPRRRCPSRPCPSRPYPSSAGTRASATYPQAASPGREPHRPRR